MISLGSQYTRSSLEIERYHRLHIILGDSKLQLVLQNGHIDDNLVC